MYASVSHAVVSLAFRRTHGGEEVEKEGMSPAKSVYHFCYAVVSVARDHLHISRVILAEI